MCVIFLGLPQRAKLKDELSTQIAEVNTFRALPASISRSFTVSARTLSAPVMNEAHLRYLTRRARRWRIRTRSSRSRKRSVRGRVPRPDQRLTWAHVRRSQSPNFHGLVQRLVLKEKEVLRLQAEVTRLSKSGPAEVRESVSAFLDTCSDHWFDAKQIASLRSG